MNIKMLNDEKWKCIVYISAGSNVIYNCILILSVYLFYLL